MGNKKIVSFKKPDMAPLPTYLTNDVIKNAILPLKVTRMRAAIKDCENLQELMEYKSHVDGLAAAAKTIKHEIPGACESLNKVGNEALVRLGRLLLKIPGEKTYSKGERHGPMDSDRTVAAKALGIDTRSDLSSILRLGAAKGKELKAVLNSKNTSLQALIKLTKPRNKKFSEAQKFGDSAAKILGTINRYGLIKAVYFMRQMDLSLAKTMEPEEKVFAKKLITEAMEILDDLDNRMSA